MVTRKIKTLEKAIKPFREAAKKSGFSKEDLKRSNEKLKNKTKAGEIFGILKGKLTRNTDDLLQEADRDFEKYE